MQSEARIRSAHWPLYTTLTVCLLQTQQPQTNWELRHLSQVHLATGSLKFELSAFSKGSY